MSRSVRAAGLILGGIDGLSPVASATEGQELFAAYARAGIRAYLLPGYLAREPERLARLVDAAREAARAAGLGRALVAIGGSEAPAFGLPPFPLAPTPLGIASSGSAAAARRAGYLLGSRLAACGVDMALAPRLDLASDPKDSAGALEGFGEDARLAGYLGAAFSRGLSRAGVAACIGRFPGLGSICRDCYEGMPFVTLPVERLERCEMRPFARVVAAGAEAVFVGRVLVPALEGDRIPASASARVIEGRLRESKGFHGLVIGDKIGPGEDAGRAAVLGALAGCDLGFFSLDDALKAAAALEKAAAAGELPAVRVETGRRRLESLLARRPKSASRRVELPTRLVRLAHRDIERGVTLLRGTLALESDEPGTFKNSFVLVFLPDPDAPEAAESEAVLSALRLRLPGAAVLGMPSEPKPKETDELLRAMGPRGRYSSAAVLSYDAHFRPAQEGLARLVAEFIPRYRVIAMRDPYDAAFFPSALGLGAAYGFSEGCASAVADLLSGRAKARGGRPVEVIGLEI